jgi:hypothetical protein
LHKEKDFEKMPRWPYPLFALAALALAVLLAASVSESFADWYNRTVGAFFRTVLAHMTSWIPFSLAELAIYCAPLVLVTVGVYAYRYRCETLRAALVYLGCILSVCSLLFSLFAFGFGVGYRTSPLDEKIALAPTEVTAQSLRETAEKLIAEVNGLCDGITYGEDGSSVMPYGREGMNEALLAAYEPVCEKYPFIQKMNSRLKPVLASRVMSYMHITGVYTYFTGEANLNVQFPDYSLCYTGAHELAHQRGIARENEANFVAFLVCSGSADVYLRYCGYLNLLEYVLNALYGADADAYREILKTVDERVQGEWIAYDRFFDAYRDSVLSDVSGTVNDAYLKLNGNEAGTKSYGLVVELAVAYFAN